jgi:transcriptional regulator with XRE-family HTH domain
LTNSTGHDESVKSLTFFASCLNKREKNRMSEIDGMRASIAVRLRAAREQSGLSQGQVAKILGLQRPSVSEIEAGRRKVSAEELTRLADIYNVSLSWLTKEEAAIEDPAIDLAARELAKLKSEDLDRVLRLLRTLRKAGGAQQ